MNPKVFVSHATEDKERFVLEFAAKLRQRGIDAWLDRWEMLPGDSLVDKIFEEGLKNAEAIIIVLSNNSVNKPWVKEELNAGIISKLKKGTKIIPVVIDNCDVPEALKSTLWERIDNLAQYENSLSRIIASIYGHTERPPLGAPPKYVTQPVFQVPGLTRIDSLVFKQSAETELLNSPTIIDPKTLFAGTDIPPNELGDSLEMLEQNGYIRLIRDIGPGPYRFRITLYGMDQYARVYIPDYSEIINDVVVSIVNKQLKDNRSIAKEVGQHLRLVDHIMDLLENKGQLKLSKDVAGGVRVLDVSVSLRRALT